jgi:hypothetical protein
MLANNGRGAYSLGLAKVLVPRSIGGLLGNTIDLASAVGLDLVSDREARVRVTILARF